MNYQHFVSDDGDVLVFENFADVSSTRIHIDNWDSSVHVPRMSIESGTLVRS